jgi:glutaredoxin/glutathione-dependent peroxiredoxin
MTIKVGDRLPSASFEMIGEGGEGAVSTDTLCPGKKVVLFGVPGAFTPTCSAEHVPSFKANAAALRAKGVDAVGCVSVNDAFVMKAWAEERQTGDDVMMLADGNGSFSEATGTALDCSAWGMGQRCTRYAMVVDDGVVTHIAVEDDPGVMTVTSAEAILAAL